MNRSHTRVGGVALFVLGAFSICTRVWAIEGAEVEYKPDVTYATVAGEELKLDLASPKGLDHAVPAVVVIHGGGWMAGKRQDMTSVAKEFAEHGYVAATISYRFAPKHRFPAQVEDSKMRRPLPVRPRQGTERRSAEDWCDGRIGRRTWR